MKKLKESTKIILGMVIGLILSTASYVLADSIIDSKNVFYKDNSGLAVNNVQDAIDGTCTKFEEKVDTFLDKVYPVGSVYISTTLDTPAKVQTALGGTWETYGKGQTLVGVDTSQNEFKTVNTTGGAKSVSYTPKGTIGSTGLTISQIPSHTHTISHTHTTAASSITNGVAANTTSTWTVYATTNDYSGSGLRGTNTSISSVKAIDSAKYSNSGPYSWFIIGYSNTHSHTVTGTIPALSTNSISTTSSGAAGKGTTSDGHTHSFTGTADSINNLQPYITVYMYKRTA